MSTDCDGAVVDAGLQALTSPSTVDVIATEQPPPPHQAPISADTDALSLKELPTPPRPPSRPSASGTKRKRVVLSIHDKQQVLQRLESGEQPISIARAFGISRQQVSDIKKNKERIVAFCIDAKHLSTLKRKTLKATAEYHPGVEQELYRWIIRQRKLGRGVSAEALTTKTSDLFLQYSGDDDAHVSLKVMTNWLRQFKKAHGIKSLSEEEIQHLPEQFVPAMDMTRPGDMTGDMTMTQPQTSTSDAVVTNSVEAVTPPGNYFITTATPTMGGGINVLPVATPTVVVSQEQSTVVAGEAASMDMNAYMHVMAQGDSQHTQVDPTASLQATANTVQQLNAQLARFEREMEVKLDYLDERVTKLCYLVLPTRLS